MEQLELLKNLKNPSFYGNDIKSVEILQTHISFIALTGKYAYKIKKSVNFGFLDFSTLEKRKYFCEEELRLNRRLCPEIYLNVVPITIKNNKLKLNGVGKVVDYAVKMKEFPQDEIMTKLLQQGKINEKVLDQICDILVEFYCSGLRSKEIDKFGTIELIKKNTDENFKQTESVIDITIKKNIFNFIKKSTNDFLERKKNLFQKRIKEGYIRDCHGDLHSGNVVISDNIYIFDCIEFNNRFRYSDIASDISFLAMDLDILGQPYLSSYLIEQYIDKSGDTGISDILNFYKCYRAYVRGKVIGFKLNDPYIDKQEKQKVIESAMKYFDLAYYYAKLFTRDLVKDERPLFFITSGLTGSGKTTVGRKISIDYNAHLISSDAVRKEIEGIEKFEKHYNSYNTGLYTPEKMFFTYKKMYDKAEDLLNKNENVILDATFKSKKLRDIAKKIAKKHKAYFLILYCRCPEKIIKKYLKERVKMKSVSDGRWEIYIKQKNSFEKLGDGDNFIELDVSKKSYNYQKKIFMKILKKLNWG